MEKKIVAVLGLALGPQGVPSPLLKERCIQAAQVAFENEDSLVIPSGADPAMVGRTEADAMRELLIKEGVAEDIIVLEDKAHDTVENAYFILLKVKEIYGSNVIAKVELFLVTSDYHMPRSVWIFQSVAKTMGLELVIKEKPSRWVGSREERVIMLKSEIGILIPMDGFCTRKLRAWGYNIIVREDMTGALIELNRMAETD